MATGFSLTPEMEQAIQNIQQRFGKQRRESDARAIGEASRRGLVNPTGTSSIEAGLRQAATQPSVESEQNIVSNLIRGGADQRREERMIGEGRQYGTSERQGREQFAGEQSALDRTLSRTLQEQGFLGQGKLQGYIDPSATSLSDPTKWQSYRQDLGGGKFVDWRGAAGQAERDRQHDVGMTQLQSSLYKPKKRKWYEGAVQGITGGVGQGIGTKLGSKWF